MKIEVENYDQEQIDELFSTEYLDINGQIYVKKEKVFELTQKFIDKLEAEGKIKFLNAAQSEALSVGNNEQAKEDKICCKKCGEWLPLLRKSDGVENVCSECQI